MNELYRFERFELDPRRRTLARADSPVVLTPKAFDVLLFLVRNSNRLVTKEELLQAVWGDTFVEEGNLKQYISHLRKALGDNSEDTRLIVTIARKGYQFTANVRRIDAADAGREPTGNVTNAATLRLDTYPILELPAGPRVSKPSPHWWKSALALSFAVIVLSGYASWRHFRAPGPARSHKVMLAVLPFENLTGDSSKEYLADGLTEEMISQLSRLTQGQLGVIARTSVMGYKGQTERLDQIGRDLSVQYVLENSLRASGNHLRLTAQLIQVKDQTHLWSKDYDYPAEDILRIQDDVARAVAVEIGPRLTPQQQTTPAQLNSANPEAFDAYLQGFYFFQKNPNDLKMAEKYYERAIQLDASYALAWVGLSRVRNRQVNTGVLPVEEGNKLARQAVERALTLDPNLAAAHAQMGRIQQQVDFDWTAANASFMRATALEPGNPEIVGMAAFSAAVLGRFDEALQLASRAVDLDPLNAGSWELLGQTELFIGQLNEAAADIKKALELNADIWPGPILSSQISILQGRVQDAWPEIKLVRHDAARTVEYAIAYSAVGREMESDGALSELITKYPGSQAYQIAEVYAFRNKFDKAFEWLERAYAQRDGGLIATKVDPLLNNLHHDPRYAAFLKKLNFPN